MKTLQLPKILSLSLLFALVNSFGSYAANSTSEPKVKQSSSGICHDKSSGSFNRTKNYIPFNTIAASIDAGGRLPKGKNYQVDKANDSAQSPILSRLGLSEEQWITLTTEFEQHFYYAVGAEHMMQSFKIHTHRKRIGGMKQAKRLLS
jgi:hypothetical protein